jgi:hypothetical protein
MRVNSGNRLQTSHDNRLSKIISEKLLIEGICHSLILFRMQKKLLPNMRITYIYFFITVIRQYLIMINLFCLMTSTAQII